MLGAYKIELAVAVAVDSLKLEGELLEKIKVSSLKSLIFLSLLYTEIEERRLLEFSKYS